MSEELKEKVTKLFEDLKKSGENSIVIDPSIMKSLEDGCVADAKEEVNKLKVWREKSLVSSSLIF